MVLSRSFTDHHLRCGGWLNFEFSKREKLHRYSPNSTGRLRYFMGEISESHSSNYIFLSYKIYRFLSFVDVFEF